MGLLDSIMARKCPRDDTIMDEVPGKWALDQVILNPGPNAPANNFIRTGYLFTVKIYRCKQCKLVEFEDAA